MVQTIPTCTSSGARLGSRLRSKTLGRVNEKKLLFIIAGIISLVVAVLNRTLAMILLLMARILITFTTAYNSYAWL